MKKLDSTLKVYFNLMRDLKVFHALCDEDKMNNNEYKLWSKYDMLFNPQNYTAEELSDGSH